MKYIALCLPSRWNCKAAFLQDSLTFFWIGDIDLPLSIIPSMNFSQTRGTPRNIVGLSLNCKICNETNQLLTVTTNEPFLNVKFYNELSFYLSQFQFKIINSHLNIVRDRIGCNASSYTTCDV